VIEFHRLGSVFLHLVITILVVLFGLSGYPGRKYMQMVLLILFFCSSFMLDFYKLHWDVDVALLNTPVFFVGLLKS
jgi:uncharacterized membrane protein (UPF0136 family)